MVLFLPQTALALQARPMPPSVVLVLKLVSANRVTPTTGIVIGGGDQVLVPAEFVSSGGEIIVLDGGTDIVKNGRPAKITHRSGAGGLAVLSVQGLNRAGIQLSENAPNPESEYHLTAFPPAEYIAKGAPPLWAALKVIQGDTDGQFAISPEFPHPYVTGPVFDACGYLVGLSMTSGPQSILPDKTPVTLFAEELRQILDSMQINISTVSCDDQAQPQRPVSTASELEKPEALPEEPANITKASGSREPNLISAEVYSPVIKRKRLNPFQGLSPGDPESESAAPPSIWRSMPIWLILLILTGLSALVWKGLFFFRLGKSHVSKAENRSVTTATLVPEDSARPRSVPLDEVQMPDIETLPDGYDAILIINGQLDAETHFKRFCIVNSERIKVVIGRGETDIRMEHPDISDEHACLEGKLESMTISDMGSSSGTFVKGVPCLPGEVLFVETGDEIYLGDIRLHISISRQETGPS